MGPVWEALDVLTVQRDRHKIAIASGQHCYYRLLTLLPLKAHIHAFGQIQVFVEFKNSIFDEV